ncbi:MAG TPA: cobalamin-dependent protein [Spirochaetota bacterium]|nr:cobalamin-dependent protein [Spirochaetota bacterium]
MKKILFIQPKFSIDKMYQMRDAMYNLGFAYLAAHLPDHWQAEFVDEELEKITYDTDADIIGITTITLYVNQAYRIAAAFRARGKKVIMGGVHASMYPDEALNYCDAVCIGDGEHVIAEMLDDFEHSRLKKKYKSEARPLTGMKLPRHDLFKPVYRFTPIATSRGCPFDCDFCAINAFYENVYRQRDVEDIIHELASLPKKKQHDLFYRRQYLRQFAPRSETLQDPVQEDYRREKKREHALQLFHLLCLHQRPGRHRGPGPGLRGGMQEHADRL